MMMRVESLMIYKSLKYRYLVNRIEFIALLIYGLIKCDVILLGQFWSYSAVVFLKLQQP